MVQNREQPTEPFNRIQVDEAWRMIGEGGSVVVDVREPNEWLSGHVKGAIHIPVNDVIGRIDELPKDRKLLFICAAGVRSALACEMAAAMGLPRDHLYNIEEGTPTWIQLKHPTSYGNDP